MSPLSSKSSPMAQPTPARADTSIGSPTTTAPSAPPSPFPLPLPLLPPPLLLFELLLAAGLLCGSTDSEWQLARTATERPLAALGGSTGDEAAKDEEE